MRQQFTAKERDIETDLDYFGARYFASRQGRFTGVEPYDINLERQTTVEIIVQGEKVTVKISEELSEDDRAQILNHITAALSRLNEAKELGDDDKAAP